MHMDPAHLRQINMTREGDVMPAYYGETANSCHLEGCLTKAKEMLAGKKISIQRHGQWQGQRRGNGIGHAGVFHLQCGHRLRFHQSQR